MLAKTLNIAKNSLKRKNFSVMIGKVIVRFQEDSAQKEQVKEWYKKNAEDYRKLLQNLDANLWHETQDACLNIKTQAQKKLQALGLDLGGGGNYPMLYFLTRYLKPEIIVETGVAAGWSSQAILTAIKNNALPAHLYSSDFPYFRYKSPEELVGYIVDDSLKSNWSLRIDGDENNLPEFEKSIQKIDLFHYDSDKSYKGRAFAYEILHKKFHKNTVILFDDIQDNAHFKDLVTSLQKPFKIFEFEGKFIGIIASFLDDH